MYPMEATETEKLIKLLEANKPLATEVISELIMNHDVSDMIRGEDYYYNQNDIRKRLHYYWKDGVKQIDVEKVNHRIPHGWHKLLVDQKAAYLVGKPISFKAEDEAYLERLNEVLNDEFDDVMPELVVAASNKGKEWLHPFINEDGEFDYMQIPAEECIPIYGGAKGRTLEAMIRYFNVDDTTVKVHVYDRQTVTYYEKTGHGELVIDVTEENNPAPHFTFGEEGYGWGEVPFIEFKNNGKGVSDLTFYKELIDSYDRIISDVDNNLEEIQSLIYVLKGYEGQGLSEFMDNLKKYKAISVEAGEGSGVDTIQAEMPINTVEARLTRVEDDIIRFGQGVNPSPDKFGNNPTGVALQNLYSLLDMKANVLERKFAKGVSWLVWFATEYINMVDKKQYSYKDVEVVFNKSMITNQAEQITMLKDSVGMISNQTIISNHPLVTDPQREEEQMKQEREEMTAAYPMEPLGGETGEESN